MFDRKLVHVSVMTVDLKEREDTPHEVVAEGPKKSSLPINQHCLHTFAVEILEVFIVPKIEGDLSEHEIVWLGIAVAQCVQISHSRLIQHLGGKEVETMFSKH